MMQTVCIYYIQGEQKMHSPMYRRWIYTTKRILREQGLLKYGFLIMVSWRLKKIFKVFNF